jgi:hypothetical protein
MSVTGRWCSAWRQSATLRTNPRAVNNQFAINQKRTQHGAMIGAMIQQTEGIRSSRAPRPVTTSEIKVRRWALNGSLCRSEIVQKIMTRCARCGAEMGCDPAGNCWCKNLPRGSVMRTNAEMVDLRAGQDRAQSGPGGTPTERATAAVGCMCRACLTRDLQAQGLLPKS